MSEMTSRKRVTLCSAIVRTVMNHGTAEWAAWLSDVLDAKTFTDRTTADLIDLAEMAHVPDLDRIREMPEEPYEEPGRYLCPDCHDNYYVAMPDFPGRYTRCLRCNPPDEDDEPEEESHA